MRLHEAPPASDALGSPVRVNLQGLISIVLFVAFIVFAAGVVSGKIDGMAALEHVREFIGIVGSGIAKLINH